MHVMVLTYGEPKKGYLDFTLGNLWATQPIVLLNLATLVPDGLFQNFVQPMFTSEMYLEGSPFSHAESKTSHTLGHYNACCLAFKSLVWIF